MLLSLASVKVFDVFLSKESNSIDWSTDNVFVGFSHGLLNTKRTLKINLKKSQKEFV